ncbi:MAG: hypothetical protein K9G11_04495 [Rickettsiaceae bacterium]|nr:hypothetical protein [Rickettsiaceae bacterium]
MQARNDAITLPLEDFATLSTDPSSQNILKNSTPISPQIYPLSPYIPPPYLTFPRLRAQPLVEYVCRRVVFLGLLMTWL